MMSAMPRVPRVPRRLAPLLAAALLAGCAVDGPRLHPLDPPPNIAEGLVVFSVPEDLHDLLSEASTLELREVTLAAVADGRRVLSGPGVADAIANRRIETGMTVDEVVLAVGSQPTRVRDQGPPGGHTLLWEPHGLSAHRRFWVRFNEHGEVTGAGTH